MLAGQATDVVLDPTSGTGVHPTGNLQIALRAASAARASSQPEPGPGLEPDGRRRRQPADPATPTSAPTVPCRSPRRRRTPNGAKGRIVLAKPFLTGDPRQDLLYQGWLYAAVVTADGHLDGLYLTKDFGQNWTRSASRRLAAGRRQASPRRASRPTT